MIRFDFYLFIYLFFFCKEKNYKHPFFFVKPITTSNWGFNARSLKTFCNLNFLKKHPYKPNCVHLRNYDLKRTQADRGTKERSFQAFCLNVFVVLPAALGLVGLIGYRQVVKRKWLESGQAVPRREAARWCSFAATVAALAPFPPQLQHSFWHGFPTHQNRQLRRLLISSYLNSSHLISLNFLKKHLYKPNCVHLRNYDLKRTQADQGTKERSFQAFCLNVLVVLPAALGLVGLIGYRQVVKRKWLESGQAVPRREAARWCSFAATVAALAPFPPQLQHSFWHGFPTHQNRQLRRLLISPHLISSHLISLNFLKKHPYKPNCVHLRNYDLKRTQADRGTKERSFQAFCLNVFVVSAWFQVRILGVIN